MVTDTELTAEHPSGALTIASTDASTVEVRRSWFHRTLRHGGQPVLRLRGLSRAQARDLELAVRHLALTPAVEAAVAWQATVTELLDNARKEQRWVPTEVSDALVASRPEPRLLDRVRAAGTELSLSPVQLEAVVYVDTDLARLVTDTNEAIMAAELSSRRGFFDAIEKTPLTEEQARAVVCFDNRVQVLAAAGSGKTSVMVARAAYAVSRGFVPTERILLLAFNGSAAAELQERVDARFAAAGIDSSGVRASTFHSFGLDVIGRATGEKPRPAPWLEQGVDLQMVERIVDELRDSSERYRYQWDQYRLLFAHAPTSLTEHEPDGWNTEKKESGYQTFGGDVVKSHGERLVADFLYFNGVHYTYERPYKHNVATADRSQYRPDFYYPDIDVWHEHWAIDRNGKPPADFASYAESMAWKRQTHDKYKTTLLETTWVDVVFGDGLAKLGAELTSRGMGLDWNPDRPPRNHWSKPMKHEELAQLVRTFMAHVKSNSWTKEHLEQRLQGDLRQLAGYRTRLFLDLYWPIHAEWERRLAADSFVDFEDMLVQAAGHLEAGRADMGYDLVMVDEFQDASRARARLVRGLLGRPDRYLFAVGDDWQSINRFAGADLSVMTGFESWFGRGHQLALTTTFRCPQTVCDVAATFVSKNPAQFSKAMRSAQTEPSAPVKILRSDNPTQALAGYLDELSAKVTAGTIAAGPDGKVSVDVLGRYRFDRHLLPARRPTNLDITFRTVHSAKGLEADYIVLPNLTIGSYGFPSEIADDPVLHLAMPFPDTFTHAEERRLFYVALTRARREVTLISPTQRISAFVAELLHNPNDPNVAVVGAEEVPVDICPRCGKGTMVQRKGPYSIFLGCSTWPRCNYKRTLQPAAGRPGQRRATPPAPQRQSGGRPADRRGG
jgi:DNA helicase-4